MGLILFFAPKDVLGFIFRASFNPHVQQFTFVNVQHTQQSTFFYVFMYIKFRFSYEYKVSINSNINHSTMFHYWNIFIKLQIEPWTDFYCNTTVYNFSCPVKQLSLNEHYLTKKPVHSTLAILNQLFYTMNYSSMLRVAKTEKKPRLNMRINGVF